MADKLICPICGEKAKPIDNKPDTTGYECVNHDKFYVTGSVLRSAAYRGAPKQRWEAVLKHAKGRAKTGEWPTITAYDFDETA
jgi:hypothetical protein